MSSNWKIAAALIVILVLAVAGIVMWSASKGPETIANLIPTASETEEISAPEAIIPMAYDPNNPDAENVIAVMSNGDQVLPGKVIIVKSSDVDITTYSEVELGIVPERIEIPSFYHRLDVAGLSIPVYAFQNKDGQICIRAYGSCWELHNNVRVKQIEGFFEADILETDGIVSVSHKGSRVSISDTDSQACVLVMDNEITLPMPEEYIQERINFFVCYNNNHQKMYRTQANINGTPGIYPCNEKGIIKKGALPVDTEAEHTNLLGKVPESPADYTEAIYPTLFNQIIVSVQQ